MSLMSLSKRMIKAVLRLRVFAPVMAAVFWWRARRLFGTRRKGSMVVLAFSSFRWKQDLQALVNAADVKVYGVDDNLVHWINAIFAPSGKKPHTDYFLERDEKILALRRRLVDYLIVLGRVLKILSGAHCAATAAVHYDQEHAWAAAFDQAGLPFIAIHKEFTVIDDRHLAERVQLMVGRAQKFLGTAVCVCSERAKRLFSEAGVAEPSRIHVTGLLRLDNVVRDASQVERPSAGPRTNVTLFSFGHYSGGLGSAEPRSHYFSAYDHQGFVELFRDVHVGFAETALKHPELTFYYKTKPGVGWNVEIRAIIEKELHRAFDSIPNLRIADPWTPAPELMRKSRVVVGLNSTVLIESRVLSRPTIMPYFAEAQSKYSYNVYFHEFHDLFATPRSKSEFMDCLERGIAGEALHPENRERVSDLLRDYVGFDDGRTAERVFNVLCKLTNRVGNPHQEPAVRSGQTAASVRRLN